MLINKNHLNWCFHNRRRGINGWFGWFIAVGPGCGTQRRRSLRRVGYLRYWEGCDLWILSRKVSDVGRSLDTSTPPPFKPNLSILLLFSWHVFNTFSFWPNFCPSFEFRQVSFIFLHSGQFDNVTTILCNVFHIILITWEIRLMSYTGQAIQGQVVKGVNWKDTHSLTQTTI